ncbi:hypothetical protein CBI38_28525 [Rhodococcus oxybenzonivorans]|uniref:DUF421 domain-containing protein n=1 Tax=Rhodococcus oxybenzonivorans TaxID=1990687 RepID=A0A2S2C4W7_9NOCA|nr:YetF domain-containing protein [Rhodococcus oxybenzonivorans]AWK75899.1 hypothetical protein CBI38_28525 [Rhodococcus oxybenzonivorans]
MWFDSWSEIARTAAVGSAAYVALIAILRISGKRTLAKLNAFDFVVTVALGSTLATILLSSDVSWTEGAMALMVLAALQYLAAAVSSRVRPVRAVMTAAPTLLLNNGKLLDDALAAQRVTAAQVRQAIRGSGAGDMTAVAAVVLESDGSMSVITSASVGDGSALTDVPRWPAPSHR